MAGSVLQNMVVGSLDRKQAKSESKKGSLLDDPAVLEGLVASNNADSEAAAAQQKMQQDMIMKYLMQQAMQAKMMGQVMLPATPTTPSPTK